jgi:hypothetical protein
MLLLPAWAGCDGCRKDAAGPDAADSADKKAPAGEFTFAGVSPLPATSLTGKAASPLTAIKPGHWFTLRQSLRSNQADQRGELAFRSSNSPLAGADIETFSFTSTRPAVLPKGRMKRLDVRLLASPEGVSLDKRTSTWAQFTAPTSLAVPPRNDHLVMRAHEYFFAILTKRPERFASFQASDWVRSIGAEDNIGRGALNYRIVFPRGDGLLALPETMLDWTNTAVLFWDDVSPSELTSEQRRALVDWLHFGGRLIINGDVMSAELASSELAPLLPIQVDGMTDLDADATANMIQRWSIAADDSKSAVSALVKSQSSRVAVGGTLKPDAVAIKGTEELLTARRVGRGEVVMSRFDLTSDWLIGWRSRDSFFNAAVLARPGRRYDVASGSLVQRYIDPTDASTKTLLAIGGPSVNTSLRLSSRDADLPDDSAVPDSVDKPNVAPAPSEFTSHPILGLGGWRDDSDAATLLLSNLRERSGVSIPAPSFVLRSLGVYLIILVPLNYIVFWLLGRLEWAWLAVPVLALLGAAWIARSVSLDLGLARNRSEVSLVELQPSYDRGHATRFTAIYNSLSGNYRVDFDSPDAAAAPVGVFTSAMKDTEPTVFRYGYDAGPSLINFAVPSNRTRTLHSEQLIDVGGTVKLEGDSLINGTDFDLTSVVLMRRSTEGVVEIAERESIDAGAKMKLTWRTPTNDLRKTYPLTAPFLDATKLPSGCSRLVALSQQPLTGMTVQPDVPLQNSVTIVLAHLIHPEVARSTGDANLLPNRKERERLMLDEEGAGIEAEVEVVK